MAGCVPIVPLRYEHVEDAPIYVDEAQLCAIVDRRAPLDDVIAVLGKPTRRNLAARAWGFTRCIESTSLDLALMLPPIPAPGRVNSCQFIVVWFDEAERATRTSSLVKDFSDSSGVVEGPQDPDQMLASMLGPVAYAVETRLAAERGESDAQLSLGSMYRFGFRDGGTIPKDVVEAWKWFEIVATTAPNEVVRQAAADKRDAVTQQLDESQRTEAKELARQWIEEFGRRH